MKILLIHNKYREAGGEDAVFHAERCLLLQHGHEVDELLFDNNEIRTAVHKLLAGLKLIYNPASARALKNKIEEFNPDVIHVHNFVPIASPSIFFMASRFNIPVVVTLHNYRLICPSVNLFHNGRIYEDSVDSLFPLGAILKGVYRDSRIQTALLAAMTAIHGIIGTWTNKVDAYITLTQFARRKFATSSVSIPPHKLVVKPNFVVDHGRGAAVREDFFLFVGRLADYKGVHTLLGAATYTPFKLVIIGDGPLLPEVRKFARTNAHVQCLGFQDKPTVIDYIKRCKALIFPSLVYEGFPVTVLEALCAGTVVIASRLGGMAEIIQHAVNGLHFEAGDELGLVSRITEINSSPEYLECLSNGARLTYLTHYTPEKNYRQLMDIYHEAQVSKQRGIDYLIHNPV